MLKDTSFVLISRGFTLIFGMLAMIIVARSLGPSLKGSYDIILLVIRTSVMLVVFGLGAANVFLGAREPEKLAQFAGNSIVAALVLGILTIGVLEILMIAPFAQTYLSENNVSLFWMRWLVALVPVMLLQQYLQEIVRAAGNIFTYAILNVVQFSLNLLFLVGLIWFREARLQTAVVAWVLAQLILGILTVWVAIRATQFRLGLDIQLFKRSLSFGIQLHPGNIAQFLNYRLDIFLVGIFLTPTEVGLYATATLLAERLWEIPTAIRTALMFHISSRSGEAVELTARTCRMIVIVTAPIYIGILLFGGTIIPLIFGEDYQPAVQPFLLLLPGIWALSLGRILVIYLASIGRPIVGTWSAIISLGFTIVLDLILIPRIGIEGAAISSSVAYALAALIIAYVFIQDTHLHYVQLVIPQNEDWILVKRLFIRTIRN